MGKLTEILDRVANELETKGLIKLAAELDKVSNELEAAAPMGAPAGPAIDQHKLNALTEKLEKNPQLMGEIEKLLKTDPKAAAALAAAQHQQGPDGTTVNAKSLAATIATLLLAGGLAIGGMGAIGGALVNHTNAPVPKTMVENEKGTKGITFKYESNKVVPQVPYFSGETDAACTDWVNANGNLIQQAQNDGYSFIINHAHDGTGKPSGWEVIFVPTAGHPAHQVAGK